MRSFENPFRIRASEHYREPVAFLRDFEAGALTLLPEGLWDRLLVIRSAPGGGKTSLMRAFTAESVKAALARPDDFTGLLEQLSQLDAIRNGQARYAGVLINLSSDYRAIADLGPETSAIRLFFRLLNARIVIGYLAAVLTMGGLRFPDDVKRIRLTPSEDGQDALTRIGGGDGQSLLAVSRRAEIEVLDLLDSLAPISLDEAKGHSDLYALRGLSGARLFVDDTEKPLLPLVMLDDGHELATHQRQNLIKALSSRQLDLARWYSERYQALSETELIAEAGTEGRDYLLLRIEAVARSPRRARRAGPRFESLLQEIANRRARPALQTYANEKDDFTDLLSPGVGDKFGNRISEIANSLLEQLFVSVGTSQTHDQWLKDLGLPRSAIEADRWIHEHQLTESHLLDIRALTILIARDRRKTSGGLFAESFAAVPAKEVRDNDVREAARLFMAREYTIPYYCGGDVVARLASQNVEQLLTIGGSMFEEMLAMITLRQRPKLPARRQHELLIAASEAMWRAIPTEVPHGGDVQALLVSIATMAQKETYRPNAPYAPGVTGTALSMTDKDALLRVSVRQRIDGADRLFGALGAAIAYNLIEVVTDQQVKGRRWMVLYLNRLLCPRFGLALQRGGFRERTLRSMAAWLVEPEASPTSGQLALG